jgi:hypothetical protein
VLFVAKIIAVDPDVFPFSADGNSRTRSHRRRKANHECVKEDEFMADNNGGGSSAAVVAIVVIFVIIAAAAAFFFFGGQFSGGGSQTKKVDVDIKAPAVPSKSP